MTILAGWDDHVKHADSVVVSRCNGRDVVVSSDKEPLLIAVVGIENPHG